MAKTRKDLRGRTLQKGEYQRASDKRYCYSYKDLMGIRTIPMLDSVKNAFEMLQEK